MKQTVQRPAVTLICARHCGDLHIFPRATFQCLLRVRIQYLAASAGELPDHQVAGFVDAAQQGGVEVGESQVCDGSGEALQQGALGETHTQDTNHSVVVGS